ncbi:MAG: hypothetical protein KDC53_01110 [Saprospiraceae bacterium]|nr:hypothetical protein [Saprospiraceae bacterium]
MSMELERTGIVLYTLEYNRCVTFYRDILKLPLLFSTGELTCFGFGDAYLMVEKDDEYFMDHEDRGRIRFCLRLNVPDVKTMVENLRGHQISVDLQEHSWGTVAKFCDPDGNLCAFRDSKSFEEQVMED